MPTRTKEQNAVSTAALAGNNGFSLISNEKLLQLYTSMLKCCRIAERVKTILPQRRNLARKYHLATGREAAWVGASIDLLPDDTLAPSQGCPLADFIRGHRLDRTISSLLGSGVVRKTSGDPLKEASDAARENKIKKNGKIVVLFRDVEAASIELWNQALGLADADQLPLLFVSYSIGLEDLDAQTANKRKVAWPYSFPSITVDGSDAVAVYRVATEAITHARKGNGPTLIDCRAVSFGDDADLDPILKMESYLGRKGLFSEESKRHVIAVFNKKLDRAIESAVSQHRQTRAAK